jgi:hypothetical protein
LAPPLAGILTPATNTATPIRHRHPDFLEELPVAGVERLGREGGLVDGAAELDFR